MMIGNMQIYLIALLTFSLPSMIVSIPAYYILRKKNRIFIADYFLPVYATTLLAIISFYYIPLCKVYAVSNTLADNILVVVCSSIISYGKILIPDRVPVKVLSISSAVIIFIITILLFLFIPSTGE